MAMKLALCILSASTLAYAAGKRGLAWADAANPQDIHQFNKAVTTWAYNWSPNPADLANSGLEFVPMQWSGSGIETFAAQVARLRAKEILGFNEPDFATQSNMKPADAAALWKKYIQPLKQKGVRLGAPAVSSAPAGRVWLREFLAACTGCQFDFLPIHWYGDGTGPFFDYIFSMNGEFKLPLWVTEFASTSTNDATVQDFMRQTIALMDTHDFVERYNWFGAMRADGSNHWAMLDASGRLNALGKIYTS